MLRTGASRSLLRTLTSPITPPVRKSFAASFTNGSLLSRVVAANAKSSAVLAVTPYRPFSTSLTRCALTEWDKPNAKDEKKFGQEKLVADPEAVTTSSSVKPLFGEVRTKDPDQDTDMSAGIVADIKTIRDTFDMTDVPRQAYYCGLAGVLPYLATSMGTVYCAWEINHAAHTGTGLIMTERTAELVLHVLEPLQVGYGAVIISFLGAIHWGLEWAGYGGYQGYRRYAIGVVAPAVAWPTVLLPAEYALIAQFLAFNFLYYTDARATRNGWAPPWYGVYRFALTFIVGASIVISLIGRGQIADRVGTLPGPTDRIKALRDMLPESVEEEEAAKRARAANPESEGEDEE